MADTAAAKKDLSGRAPMTITGDAIHAETIRKELRNFRLNENFILSPTAIKSMEIVSFLELILYRSRPYQQTQ